MPLAFAAGRKGILPDHMIEALAQAGAILRAYDFVPDQVQPASLDLRLGEVAYRVRASFLPGPSTTVAEKFLASFSSSFSYSEMRSSMVRCLR